MRRWVDYHRQRSNDYYYDALKPLALAFRDFCKITMADVLGVSPWVGAFLTQVGLVLVLRRLTACNSPWSSQTHYVQARPRAAED